MGTQMAHASNHATKWRTSKAMRLANSGVKRTRAALREAAQNYPPLRNAGLNFHSNHMIEQGTRVLNAIAWLCCPRRKALQIIPTGHLRPCASCRVSATPPIQHQKTCKKQKQEEGHGPAMRWRQANSQPQALRPWEHGNSPAQAATFIRD